MPNISGPSDGPVAVTGAAGFVGAHLVKNLVEHGYAVHACLRDTGREDKMVYLQDIASKGPGTVKFFSCDLYKAEEGEYDEAFSGCSVVFHVAADIGSDAATYGRITPLKMYEGIVDMTASILESCRKAGTVKRVIYTSSVAAILGQGAPDRPDDYVYTEDDWCGGTYETLEERYTNEEGEMLWTNEKQAYSKGKLDAERICNAFGEETGIDVISICPFHIMGPLLGVPHNTTWQHRLGMALKGEREMEANGTMKWNIIDVRDIAEAQRLAAESDVATNGSRYCLTAKDESGEPPGDVFLDMLQGHFPNHNPCGGYRPEPTDDRHRCRCTRAINELGLVPHSIEDTLRDTGNSLIELGCVPASS
jgi:nucleoside-diphosphate-sugar epimerase|tara:strand:+ start:602 stop:1693 length:1092 start_codon:yes stop_codon:yes gene_type:complete